jgi:endonuclease YncB( thermonuclease family)
MRQQLLRVGIFIGLLLAIGLLIATRHSPRVADERPAASSMAAPTPESVAGTGFSTTEAPSANGPPSSEPSDRQVRDVTPQGVLRVLTPPAAPSGKRTPRSGSSLRIAKAGVSPTGTITGEGGSVRLYGIAFPDARKICKRATGESWACGRRAYIALHNKVAAATLDCEPRTAAEATAADCFVGEVNLAVWLLAQGLVRRVPEIGDKELVAAEAAAHNAKLGLWSDPSEATAAVSTQQP